jgi:menaquinone-9 beta-reductase
LFVTTLLFAPAQGHTLHRAFFMNFLTATKQADLFIAGAGPAGLACAIAAALRGLTVHVADGMKPPIDKACGEGLMPDTIAALAELGVDISPAASATLTGIRFIGNPDQKGVSTSIQASFPETTGRGIKRLLLHQLLLDRALELGVRFHWQTVVQGIEQGMEQNIIQTNQGQLHARYIVGADGHQSRVRNWAGLDRSAFPFLQPTRRIGLRQHFAIAPWTSHVEVYWSHHGQAYVTPVSSSEVCVAFVARHKFATVYEALRHFPQLHSRLASPPTSDAPRGSITLGRRLHRVTRGNVALIGDASGSVDAITGEGLALCFRQALALAQALHANNLAQYQRAHTTLRRLPHLMAYGLLSLDRSPRLRARVFNALERHPHLFQQMLEVHIGHRPLSVFGSQGLLAAVPSLLIG